MEHSLTVEDFADSFGTAQENLPEECRRLIAETDFSYRIPIGKERDGIILESLRKTDSDTQVVGAPERQDTWQRGWEENVKQFEASKYSLDSLVPKFIRPGLPIRLKGDFILPTNPMFELAYLRVFRLWLFKTYFSKVDSVCEFGCGTGFNLTEMAQVFPKKTYVGLDFVPASAALIDRIGQIYGWQMVGRIFDFTKPDRNFRIDANAGVFTFGAIEQVAGKFEAFLQYLLRQPISFCVNIEPTFELYDDRNLIDYLAIRFHKKRGYTANYLTRLRELEAAKIIEILKVKRLFFGSQLMEGYTYIIWRPRQGERKWI